MTKISITHDGIDYTASTDGDWSEGCEVVIVAGGHWAGTGRLDGGAIECSANLPDGVYEALDAAISLEMAREDAGTGRTMSTSTSELRQPVVHGDLRGGPWARQARAGR